MDNIGASYGRLPIQGGTGTTHNDIDKLIHYLDGPAEGGGVTVLGEAVARNDIEAVKELLRNLTSDPLPDHEVGLFIGCLSAFDLPLDSAIKVCDFFQEYWQCFGPSANAREPGELAAARSSFLNRPTFGNGLSPLVNALLWKNVDLALRFLDGGARISPAIHQWNAPVFASRQLQNDWDDCHDASAITVALRYNPRPEVIAALTKVAVRERAQHFVDWLIFPWRGVAPFEQTMAGHRYDLFLHCMAEIPTAATMMASH